MFLSRVLNLCTTTAMFGLPLCFLGCFSDPFCTFQNGPLSFALTTALTLTTLLCLLTHFLALAHSSVNIFECVNLALLHEGNVCVSFIRPDLIVNFLCTGANVLGLLFTPVPDVRHPRERGVGQGGHDLHAKPLPCGLLGLTVYH